MVNPIVGGSDRSLTNQSDLYTTFQDVVDTLSTSFPDKSKLEIEQAITDYMTEVGADTPEKVDSQKMCETITQLFNAELTTQANHEIRKAWEATKKNNDIDLTHLADMLDTFPEDGIEKADRNLLVLLWQMLQGKLEKAIGEESTVVANINKNQKADELDEYLTKKAEEMEKAGKTKFWNKLLKWVGVAASVVGAAVACAVAAVAFATGVGAVAGALLVTSATIMVGLAVAGAASAIADEFGVEWSLGEGVGRLIGKGLNALGLNVDEDMVAKITGIVVQLTLAAVAIACSFGAGFFSSAGSVASAGTKVAGDAVSTGAKVATTGAKVASQAAGATSKLTNLLNGGTNILKLIAAGLGITQGLVQGGAAIANFQLAQMQADLMELKALLDKLTDIQNIEQELAAAILKIIFEAMRGNVANAMDTLVKDMELAAGINLAKA